MARRKGEILYFAVQGSGQFPFDMLRYDCCWPVREGHDTGRMAPLPGERLGRRVLLMATRSERGPTEGRWASFNWQVVTADTSQGEVERAIERTEKNMEQARLAREAQRSN